MKASRITEEIIVVMNKRCCIQTRQHWCSRVIFLSPPVLRQNHRLPSPWLDTTSSLLSHHWIKFNLYIQSTNRSGQTTSQSCNRRRDRCECGWNNNNACSPHPLHGVGANWRRTACAHARNDFWACAMLSLSEPSLGRLGGGVFFKLFLSSFLLLTVNLLLLSLLWELFALL